MSGNPPIASREAALRIAHAARLLNGLEVKAFVGALVERYDLPLTETRLAQITVEDLRGILAGNHAEENCIVGVEPDALKAVIKLFKGEGVEGSDLPAVEAYADGDLPRSIRVAIASNRAEELDGHFGSCERFLIYQVSSDAIKLIAVRGALEADQEEDKNAARAALIRDCQILYLQSIGGPAAAKVVRAGVHPVKQPGGGAARTTLAQLQQHLNTPPPWLARIMGVPAASLQKYGNELDEDIPAAEEA
ncbi:MAG: dinitrogenase iron-molybdenum cofactor biosynthesis protein [Zoogloeaceae bacterium]|jgi:nitrogen fixation protein NifX|nr:dinitrogenase iron-molybdenum cofactor biosynthesis protein [Zoogloeaceae bacterium]